MIHSWLHRFAVIGIAFSLPGPAGADEEAKIPVRDHPVNQAKLISPKAEHDSAGSDLLRFENGDVIHGKFAGVEKGLLWDRKDLDRPIKFGLEDLLQVVFKEPDPLEVKQETGYVSLVSGDRIPGEVVSLDQEQLILKSPVLGELAIPRAHLTSLTPNPYDGHLYYAGPYTSDGWMTVDSRVTEEQIQELENKKEEDPDEEKEPTVPSWIHSGAAFYSMGSRPLAFDANLPDRGRIIFNVAWKGRLNLAIGLHSDFTRPQRDPEDSASALLRNLTEDDEEEEAEKEEEAKPLVMENLLELRNGKKFQSVPWLWPGQQSYSAHHFGTSYVVKIASSYPSLQQTSFSEQGLPRDQRLQSRRVNFPIPDNSEAEIEIRFDREQALIMLFVDGNYFNQWNDLSGYHAKGSGLGFATTSSSSKVRISDLLITSWNGLTDSAGSVSRPDRDVALLTNGTDRFSGKLIGIKEGLAILKTDYSEVKIPLSDLSEITLQESTQTKFGDEGDSGEGEDAPKFEWKENSMTVVFRPVGQIRLNPSSASETQLSGSSPFLGSLNLQLKGALMIRFRDSHDHLSDWFEDF